MKGRPLLAADKMFAVDRADLDGPPAQEVFAVFLGDARCEFAAVLLFVRQLVRARQKRGIDLVFGTHFGNLERGRHVKDLPAMLDRDHAPGTKARTVAAAVDLVENGNLWVSRQEKIRVKRVADARLDGARSSDERLTEHLAAKHALEAIPGTRAPKDVLFDGFEIEQRDQLFNR